jgi:predicted nucleotidyltransferase
MELSSYFKDFLTDVRLQANDRERLKNAHKDLRERLTNDEKLSGLIVNTFLQGSYRRSTAVRPLEEKRTDVDVVVVTKIDESVSPDQAMEEFKPFLEEHYKDQWEKQGRSIGICIDSVDLDLVITSAPSESDQEALKSASVSDDEDLEEAPDLRFVPAWVGMSDRRSYSFTKSMLERAQNRRSGSCHPCVSLIGMRRYGMTPIRLNKSSGLVTRMRVATHILSMW